MKIQVIDLSTQIVLLDVFQGDRLVCTLREFLNANGMEESLPVVQAISRNERIVLGGGAAPLIEISRLVH